MPLSESHQPKLKLSIGQVSDSGIKEKNEDSIGICVPESGALLTKGVVAVIADGLGCAEGAKEASEICVRNFISDYYSTPDTWSVCQSAQKIIVSLNRWLYSHNTGYVDTSHGYVTTMSSLILKSRTAHIFHVGDSRIYHLRGGDLRPLTRDHSTSLSGQASQLNRAMGYDVSVEVDYRQLDVQEGDVFFLSTDGIHDWIARDRLQAQLNEALPPQAICDALVQEALKNGSDDNISCQYIKVEELPKANLIDTNAQLSKLPFPPELEVGMVLDGYRVEAEIYASQRSQVYKVVDVESGEVLCMKTPSVNYEDDPGFIDRFIMEAWIGRRINSPHVLKIRDPKPNRSCLYVLTEYIEGVSLDHWIRRNPSPDIKDVLQLADQMLKGMRAFHRRETLHEDIKPGNIMLDLYGQIRIVDFGSCKVRGVDEMQLRFAHEGILGTASYSAPEVVIHQQSSDQSDLFSIGAVIFEMITGKPIYKGELENCKSLAAYQRLKYESAQSLNPLVPLWLDGVLQKAVEIDPTKRFGDASEFMHALKHPSLPQQKLHETSLLARNPVAFWQTTSAVLLLVCLFLLLSR